MSPKKPSTNISAGSWTPQAQLAEHREFGLPDFPKTGGQFSEAGWQTATFKLANVYKLALHDGR